MLRSRIDQLILGSVRRLVVSLDKVSFLDSSGLSALVAGARGMEEAGGRLVLVCRDEALLKIFTVTGLDRVFSIHDTLDQALM